MSTTIQRSERVQQSSSEEGDPNSNRESTATAEEPQQGPPHLSKDLIFELLKAERRRRVLRYLDDGDGTATIDGLARHIAAKEHDITIQELSSQQRKRVYIALYQCHLPKMDDVGVIDYSKSRGTIELTDTADCLFPYLYLDRTQHAENSDPFHPLRHLSEMVLTRLSLNR